MVRAMVESHLSAEEYQVVAIIALITRKPGERDAAVSEDALLRHELTSLAAMHDGTPVRDDTWIWQPIEQAMSHGFILRFTAEHRDTQQNWYLLNTIENARFVAALANGAASVPEYVWIDQVAPRVVLDRPTVFRLYEQNIGPLTPLIAERLIRAVESYPVDWIESAIGEAVTYNRRNWRYIARILENWATDGLPTSTGNR